MKPPVYGIAGRSEKLPHLFYIACYFVSDILVGDMLCGGLDTSEAFPHFPEPFGKAQLFLIVQQDILCTLYDAAHRLSGYRIVYTRDKSNKRRYTSRKKKKYP